MAIRTLEQIRQMRYRDAYSVTQLLVGRWTKGEREEGKIGRDWPSQELHAACNDSDVSISAVLAFAHLEGFLVIGLAFWSLG